MPRVSSLSVMVWALLVGPLAWDTGARAARMADDRGEQPFSITGCTPRVVVGGRLCVCGSFPVPLPPNAFRIDGRLAAIVSSDSGRVELQLPDDIAPGPHVVTPSAQSRITGNGRFEVVRLTSVATPARLRRGERAQVSVRLEGTEEAITIQLANFTPNVVVMEGGDLRRLTTSGGADNRVTVSVTARENGTFRIESLLSLGPCPCGTTTLTRGPSTGGDVGDPPPPPPPTTTSAPPSSPVPLGILLRRDDDAWVPAAEPAPAACVASGQPETTVTARIYELWNGRWVESDQARPITIRIGETSREPGKAINADLLGVPKAAPDLYLPQEVNAGFACRGAATPFFNECVTLQPQVEARAVVRATDYGAFGRAEASCPGCAQLTRAADGTLAPDRSRAGSIGAGVLPGAVTLPRDDNGNGIADVLTAYDALPIAADTDAAPASAFAGDGLSVYEEYRGVMASGCHHRTPVETKDLFIHNPIGFNLALFKMASGLSVWEIRATEWSARVINFNRGRASLVEQHGLLIQAGTAPALANWYSGPHQGYSIGRGTAAMQSAGTTVLPAMLRGLAALPMVDGYGPPKNVEMIVIDRPLIARLHGGGAGAAESRVVAHELGHGIGMRHHGDIQPATRSVRLGPAPPGAIFLVPPRIFLPASPVCGVPITATADTPVLFGHRQDAGSGDVNCLMVHGYDPLGQMVETAPGTVCCMGGVPTGTYLSYCSNAAGTGQNAGGACKGNASRGNCKNQLNVNDAT